jgi:hypothetical protein
MSCQRRDEGDEIRGLGTSQPLAFIDNDAHKLLEGQCLFPLQYTDVYIAKRRLPITKFRFRFYQAR